MHFRSGKVYLWKIGRTNSDHGKIQEGKTCLSLLLFWASSLCIPIEKQVLRQTQAIIRIPGETVTTPYMDLILFTQTIQTVQEQTRPAQLVKTTSGSVYSREVHWVWIFPWVAEPLQVQNIVACQRGGVSNKPPGQRQDTGPGILKQLRIISNGLENVERGASISPHGVTFDSPFLLRQGEPGTSQYIPAL